MSVKNILISQQQPMTASPYTSIAEKFGVNFDFKPFFKIEPLTSREFRAQRINILDHTAIVFSARSTIDAFFQICEELRVKVPETMKYFCTTEAVANYLQKHIVYRKRKIFFGDGKPDSIIEKMVGGKINKFFEQNCLNQQEFVKDSNFSVEKYLATKGLKIVDFVRFKKGEEPDLTMNIPLVSAIMQAVSGEKLAVDGKIVTGQAAGTSFEFGLKLIEVLSGSETADRVRKEIYL